MKPITGINAAVQMVNGALLDFAEDGCRGQIGNLRFIASWSGGWDHVSVSRADRCPTWDEMQFIRQVCFRDSEWVVQFSPPVSEHINNHLYCLHMWRCQKQAQPTPPGWMVGINGVSPEQMKVLTGGDL